ncbi:hypothetical protein [Rhodopila sp.]|uniref:hypothetical protein n=1 Tax=Rhodopila sp. TaxID=2480087 RepID=UPI003D0EE736
MAEFLSFGSGFVDNIRCKAALVANPAMTLKTCGVAATTQCLEKAAARTSSHP